MKTHPEICIVGAGPAGVMTALFLSKEEYLVHLLIKLHFPGIRFVEMV